MNQKDLSIIIPHLGESKSQEFAFNECFASLRESAPEVRIVVAKNGAACVHPRDVRVLAQGQCKAVNAAVAITDTPWIMVTNDDMIYAPGWWDALFGFTSFQCVSPKLVESSPGAPTFEVYPCGGAGGDFDKQKFFDFVKTYKGQGLRKGFNLPFVISRELWNLIGGYDINYDPWGSNGDSDLEYKIRLAGVQPMQNTDCVVYHFGQTSGTFHQDNQYYYNRNFDYFKEKWGFRRYDEGIWTADFEMPDKERIYRPWWEGHYGKP